MPAPKTPQQEAEEQKLRDAEELEKRRKEGKTGPIDGPSVSSKIGEHSAEIDSGGKATDRDRDENARKVDEAAERRERGERDKP